MPEIVTSTDAWLMTIARAVRQFAYGSLSVVLSREGVTDGGHRQAGHGLTRRGISLLLVAAFCSTLGNSARKWRVGLGVRPFHMPHPARQRANQAGSEIKFAGQGALVVRTAAGEIV